MSPIPNDSNRRRPIRRGDGPGMGPGSPRDFSRGRPGRGPADRPARGPGDPRKMAGSSTFRRRAPRPEGDAPLESRRWSRDRAEAPSPEKWRRPDEGNRPRTPSRAPSRGPSRGPSQEGRQWRPARRDEKFSRPLRTPRWERPEPADVELPQGEAHAGAAPSDLIWGRHSAQAALESGRPIHRIWCTPEMRFRPVFLQLLREAKASGVLVEEVSWARLGQISGGAVHQGIVLQPAAADTLDLPSLIEGCRQLGESPLLVAVDGLTDPQNLGAILRSAEALGVHGLVLPQRRNAGLTGSVAKVAAGALEHLPVARVVNLNRALDSLRQEGYRVVGLDAKGTVSLEEADLEGPLVVITGSEGQGLSLLTRRSCDQLVRIPLRGATPSLNASVATALVLYEVARRGWMRGLKGSAPPPRLMRPSLATQPLELEPDAPPAAPELFTEMVPHQEDTLPEGPAEEVHPADHCVIPPELADEPQADEEGESEDGGTSVTRAADLPGAEPWLEGPSGAEPEHTSFADDIHL